MEFGYRADFSLYENGVVKVFYSSSAADSGVDFYRIGNDGFTPELADFFATGAVVDDWMELVRLTVDGIFAMQASMNFPIKVLVLVHGARWV